MVRWAVTHGDFDEALDEVIDNNKIWADKNGLSQEEAESAMDMAILMKGMAPEEREQFLNEKMKTNPGIVQKLVDDAIENNSVDRVEVYKVSSKDIAPSLADEVQKMKGLMSSSSDDLIAKTPSKITSIFTSEAQLTENSFVLDEPIVEEELSAKKEVFALDV